MKNRPSLLRLMLAFYKRTLSPVLAFCGAGGCRFTPTCSEYFVLAVEKNGVLLGAWLGLKRLGRCQPWGGSGEDLVPSIRKAAPCSHPHST